MKNKEPAFKDPIINDDIFNLDNTSDIAKEVSAELNLRSTVTDTRRLLDLFNLKNKLTSNEILVALYRLHKIKKTRTWVHGTLYALLKKNLLQKGEDGSWGRQ